VSTAVMVRSGAKNPFLIPRMSQEPLMSVIMPPCRKFNAEQECKAWARGMGKAIGSRFNGLGA
jgi:hypothetical protein